MTSDISYKTHILVGVRPSGMTVLADWPYVPKQSEVQKEIERGQRLCDVRALHADINNAGERRWLAEERVMGTRPAGIKSAKCCSGRKWCSAVRSRSGRHQIPEAVCSLRSSVPLLRNGIRWLR